MKHLICNLKAQKNYYDMLLYKDFLKHIDFKNINFILAPSNIYLPLFNDTNINLCTQDITAKNIGNITGNITIEQLKSLNVKYTIIGHYERYKYYHETIPDIIKKAQNALEQNLKIILCLGETKEELARKVEYQTLSKKISQIFNNINPKLYSNIIIAYEPTYLIGTNTSYNITKIKETINFIKNIIYSYYNYEIPIVFGGNITPDNISELNTLKEIDGFIVSSSVLNPANLELIVEKMTIPNK